MSFDKPNYTQIPNILLDEMIQDMGDSELRVVLAIARATLGWQKKRDKLSLSLLQKKTGLSRQGVVNGINAALEHDVIRRYKSGQSWLYELHIKDSKLVNEVDQNTGSSQRSRPATSQPGRPELVNEVDTQKKDLKKKTEKAADEPSTTTAVPRPEPIPVVVVEALKKIGIFESSHRRIWNGWLSARGVPLEERDVKAMGMYLYANQNMGTGAVVEMLARGESVPDKHYYKADIMAEAEAVYDDNIIE